MDIAAIGKIYFLVSWSLMLVIAQKCHLLNRSGATPNHRYHEHHRLTRDVCRDMLIRRERLGLPVHHALRVTLGYLLSVLTGSIVLAYFLLFVSGVRLHMLSQAMSWARPLGMALLLVSGLFIVGFFIYTMETYARRARESLEALYRQFLHGTGTALMGIAPFHVILLVAARFGPLALNPRVFEILLIIACLIAGRWLRRRAAALAQEAHQTPV